MTYMNDNFYFIQYFIDYIKERYLVVIKLFNQEFSNNLEKGIAKH